METTFERKTIGRPDAFRLRRIYQVIDKIAEAATQTKWGMDDLYGDSTDEYGNKKVPLGHFSQFINSTNPEYFLTQKFIEKNKISVPGISIEKLIASKMIDIPKMKVDDCLQGRVELLKLTDQLGKENYSIPLEKLYYSEDNLFGFDPERPEFAELNEQIVNDLSVYTQTVEQNKIVEILENYCNATNDLVELGILPSDQRCLNPHSFLIAALTVDRTSNRPAVLSQRVFLTGRLKQFGSNNQKIRPGLNNEENIPSE